ncbi:MAG: metal-sensitive transcriptional regulator [Clostridia bacterium]|nr:metal-sensitive transcriptional regulator [Clostridia bacterium]
MAAPTPDARKRDVAALLRRLRRIEGQVRGLQRMVEEERYCIDILQQLMAARAALDQVGLTLLEDHLRGCVAHAIRTGEGEASIDEMMEVVRQFLG